MTTNSSSLSVSFVTLSSERDAAVKYIEGKMRHAFGCEPPETIGAICIARLGTDIVGSLVLQGAADGCPLSIEEHYEFNCADAPFPFVSSHMVQATRWTASHPDASTLVCYACALLAHDLGKEYMIIEAKPPSVKRLRELGICCEPIETTTINLEQVKKHVNELGMKYYLEAPLPTLYMLPLPTMLSACRIKLAAAGIV